MFTTNNTTGFTEDQLDEMNNELYERLDDGELFDMPRTTRINRISESILNNEKRF